MSRVNPREREILESQFPKCRRIEAREDIVFVCVNGFHGDACEIVSALQATADFLKYVTCLDPTQCFGSRIMVGHSKSATQANWSGEKGNRIQIPWKDEHLKKDILFHSFSHEIVHPFYKLSPLHKSRFLAEICA